LRRKEREGGGGTTGGGGTEHNNSVFKFVGRSRYISYGSAKEHAGGGEKEREGMNHAGQRTAPVSPGEVSMYIGRDTGLPSTSWKMDQRSFPRREEPQGAEDGTHVPCRIVLRGGQGHGPSITQAVY